MLPEKVVLDGGVGGREQSAPMHLQQTDVAALGRIPLRQEAVLRLTDVAVPGAPAAADVPVPLLLTTIAQNVAAAAATADAALPDAWTGAALRRAREVRGLTLGKLADATKITRHHLENIEGDRYEQLPSYVYLRGILMNVARELRLDADRVCRSYLDAARQATGAQ